MFEAFAWYRHCIISIYWVGYGGGDIRTKHLCGRNKLVCSTISSSGPHAANSLMIHSVSLHLDAALSPHLLSYVCNNIKFSWTHW